VMNAILAAVAEQALLLGCVIRRRFVYILAGHEDRPVFIKVVKSWSDCTDVHNPSSFGL